MTFRAVAARAQAMGRTAGEAIDALTSQLDDDQSETLIIVRDLRPDQFFDASQRERLRELTARWRSARDSGTTMSAVEQSELEALIDSELVAAAERSAALRRELAL
jgi:hypothetical protein